MLIAQLYNKLLLTIDTSNLEYSKAKIWFDYINVNELKSELDKIRVLDENELDFELKIKAEVFF